MAVRLLVAVSMSESAPLGTVLAITFPDNAVSSAVVNASSCATGASLTADTVMLTVAVLESNDPSLSL